LAHGASADNTNSLKNGLHKVIIAEPI